MIYTIILDHINSREYTINLISNINGIDHTIINSSDLNTAFTESFNIAIEKAINSNYEYIMICNNDISLNYIDIENIYKYIYKMKGIFSAVFNSPHNGVMSVKTEMAIREVPWIEFVAPIFSKSVLEKVGFLDSNLSYGWGVELDYCYRASLSNYRTYLVQAVSASHFGHKSQDNHSLYAHEANLEMNHVLSQKYGPAWQEILSYPQWS